MHPDIANLDRIFCPAPTVRIDDPILPRGTTLWIKREDLLHPIISGNKWRKLKYVVDHALSIGCNHLVSMGGLYSNHLHALAYIGRKLGLKTTGIIRGERPIQSNATLQDIESWGMSTVFVSRSLYRKLREYKQWDSKPGKRYRGYWIPEGGCCPRAMTGVMEMVDDIPIEFQTIALACGTGTTLAGVTGALNPQQNALGFAVLKNAGFLNEDVKNLVTKSGNTIDQLPEILLHYHFGGFAKQSPSLTAFISEFETRTGIPLESIYTGKMMYGLYDLITTQENWQNQRIVAIHTGGLQGRRS